MVRPKGTKKINNLTYMQIKIDAEQKKQIEDVAMRLGMTLSSFVRFASLEYIKRENRSRQ